MPSTIHAGDNSCREHQHELSPATIYAASIGMNCRRRQFMPGDNSCRNTRCILSSFVLLAMRYLNWTDETGQIHCFIRILNNRWTGDEATKPHTLGLLGHSDLKLTCHLINRRHFCFNIKSISVHPLLWMNVMLDFICMVFAGMWTTFR